MWQTHLCKLTFNKGICRLQCFTNYKAGPVDRSGIVTFMTNTKRRLLREISWHFLGTGNLLKIDGNENENGNSA